MTVVQRQINADTTAHDVYTTSIQRTLIRRCTNVMRLLRCDILQYCAFSPI